MGRKLSKPYSQAAGASAHGASAAEVGIEGSAGWDEIFHFVNQRYFYIVS